MSNQGWTIATILMVALGVFFIADHHPKDQAAGLSISTEIEGPVGGAERK